MHIHVKALRPFKEALGAGDIELERPEGETVEGLIRHLVAEHPAFANARGMLKYLRFVCEIPV